jgi:uncharacterized protein YbjT (DUF2867 family)
MTYRAVVIGATGAVGGALVRELQATSACKAIVALTRRPLGPTGALKTTAHLVDFDNLEAVTASAAAGCTVAFCTLGIGQPRKVPFDEFRRVDVDYAGAFARGAAAAGARHISLLSSVGANLASRSKYLRVKGEAEDVVSRAGIARTSLFRPSLLVTSNIRYGLQDWLTQHLFPVVAPLLPQRYHGIRVEDLARAMRLNAEASASPGVEVLEYPELLTLLRAS